MLDVIVPVCNEGVYTRGFLNCILTGTVIPDHVLIIDNNSSDDTASILVDYKDRLPLVVYRQSENLGVNKSWNLGLEKSEADIVSILNNDIILPPRFFESILKVFNDKPDAGVVIPTTMASIDEVSDLPPSALVDCKDELQCGWAFSMRRGLARPVPDTLDTFYGDRWLLDCSLALGYKTYRMRHCNIYHYVSRTLYSSGRVNSHVSDVNAWAALTRPKYHNLHWSQVPMAIDLACYAPWYQTKLRKLIKNVIGPRVIEIGVRYGCSARVLLEELKRQPHPFQLSLIDIAPTAEAMAIVDNQRVHFLTGPGQDFVHNFRDESVDLIHIDIDPHDGIAELELFNLYSPKLTPQGAIIFHDATDAFGIKRMIQQNIDWQAEYCKPLPESPLSAPCIIYKKR